MRPLHWSKRRCGFVLQLSFEYGNFFFPCVVLQFLPDWAFLLCFFPPLSPVNTSWRQQQFEKRPLFLSRMVSFPEEDGPRPPRLLPPVSRFACYLVSPFFFSQSGLFVFPPLNLLIFFSRPPKNTTFFSRPLPYFFPSPPSCRPS